jgi:hypothetical protein
MYQTIASPFGVTTPWATMFNPQPQDSEGGSPLTVGTGDDGSGLEPVDLENPWEWLDIDELQRS